MSFSTDRPAPINIARESIEVERKTFTFELRENEAGRFLRVTEINGRNRDLIVIPESGIPAFREALQKMEGVK